MGLSIPDRPEPTRLLYTHVKNQQALRDTEWQAHQEQLAKHARIRRRKTAAAVLLVMVAVGFGHPELKEWLEEISLIGWGVIAFSAWLWWH
jgi:hypothetical protein